MSSSASKVQEKVASIGAGTTTFAATFDTAATAGNLIVWVCAVDGNSGTTTQPSDTPNLPIELKSNDVSLILAWGVADGGETAISGTVGSNVAGGRCWIVELNDSAGTGSWARRGTTTIFTASGGATSADAVITSTPTITEGGYGIAAATWDAVATAGTAAWSNSWVKDFDGSSGTAVSLWTATKSGIAAGGTESTTLTRTGGTAEQYQALLVVFGKVAPTGVTGAMAGAVRTGFLSGTLAGTVTDQGALAGVTSPAVGALVGSNRGALAGTLSQATGALVGKVVDLGGLAGTTPVATGALAGKVIDRGALAASPPRVVSTLAGTHPAVGALAATLRMPVSTLREGDRFPPGPWKVGTPTADPGWGTQLDEVTLTDDWRAGEPTEDA